MIEVDEAAPDKAPILQNLVQVYVYDFSEMAGCDVGPDDRYKSYGLAHYWTEPSDRAFPVRVDGKLAGLALVEQVPSLRDGQPAIDITEFFMLRKYRRQGVGEPAARFLFDRFPGRWHVR
jgi:predicted acetyltransferase